MKNSSELKRRVAEAAAILVSILLAFGIDAAWEGRGDRAEELRTLSALHAEFVVNQSRVAESIAFHAALRSTGFALLEAAKPGAPALLDGAIDEMVVNFTWWGGFFVFESASLDAVILGGKLDVIQNEDLRRLLTGWRGALEQTAKQEATEFVHYNEAWLPLLKRRANLAQIGNAGTTVPGSEAPYLFSPVPDPMPLADHQSLLTDPGFLNAIVEKLWIEDAVLQEYANLEVKVAELLESLEHELEG